MPHFKLTLETMCEQPGIEGSGGKRFRVVEADSKETAKKIGNVMLGEPVAAGEHIHKIISVEPTNEPYRIGSWYPDKLWAAVKSTLGTGYRFIQENGRTVGVSLA